jgi:hypothetical protein
LATAKPQPSPLIHQFRSLTKATTLLCPIRVRRTEEARRGVLKVVGTFEIKSRNLFVVFGTLTEGELRPGMTVAAPLGGNLSVTGTIESVEFVDFVAYREIFKVHLLWTSVRGPSICPIEGPA